MNSLIHQHGTTTRFLIAIVVTITALSTSYSSADDWNRFRGPNGSGIAANNHSTPLHWNPHENVRWSVALPGPGNSSPIVVGHRVWVTCWSGYGLDRQEPGDQQNLKRHLLCFDRTNGNMLWSQVVDPYLPEDKYEGMFTEHGYASHTPVSDGKRVFAFFGKTGVVAFDVEGNKLWHTSLGTRSGASGWGTASSPILYKNFVIVPATAESHSLVALDQQTGSEVWRHKAEGYHSTWSTPILVDAPNGRQVLVVVVPQEIWGIDPDTGKLLWYCRGPQSETACASAIASDGIVYAIGGRNAGSTAVRVGGTGDVSDSHILWTGDHSISIGTPLLHKGLIYWFSRGVAYCIDASNGETVYRERLSTDIASSSSAGKAREALRGRSYVSPVAADGKLYFLASSGYTFVQELGRQFKQLALNPLGKKEEEFQGTPAISNGELFIRSSRKLYCIGATD